MEKKIKEMYNCKKLSGEDPLITWYNCVIEKTEEELTVADVARCIRQNLFLEVTYEMLLVYLLNNPYEGDAYAGELMDKASDLDPRYLKTHKDTVQEIVDKAYRFIEKYKWECNEDKLEYIDAVKKFSESLK